ncbi:MAG TPA: DUF1700 domain-containing protein [Rudaea sp.]|nr:DUF1700 domain-containing protein [Rudaea sp.]
METQLDPSITDYLRRLGWALAPLPAADAQDIVEETRSHIAESIGRGEDAARVLGDLGPPEVYARSFVGEMQLAKAVTAQQLPNMFGVVAARLHRSIAAALAFAIVALLAAIALAMIGMVISKLIDPAHTGLWWSDSQFFLGTINDPEKARDLLGLWLYPAAVFGVLLCWLLARLVLVRALTAIVRKPSATAQSSP